MHLGSASYYNSLNPWHNAVSGCRMRRQGQYGDAGVNPLMAAQMQQMSAQRMHYNSGVGHFPERADEEHKYLSSKAEGHWKWDRDGSKGSKPMSPHIYRDGQASDAARPEYQGEMLDNKMGADNQMNRDSRVQPHHHAVDAEAGLAALDPRTFEGLEETFLKDIMKLTKEQHEAEDKENARHRERLSEINAQYEEKLATMRARQAARRDEFLRKESHARHQQYQQASIGGYHSSAGPSESYGYGGSSDAAASAAAQASVHDDPHHGFGRGNFDSYRERAELAGGARNREFDSRNQYPGGRAYNSGGRYF